MRKFLSGLAALAVGFTLAAAPVAAAPAAEVAAPVTAAAAPSTLGPDGQYKGRPPTSRDRAGARSALAAPPDPTNPYYLWAIAEQWVSTPGFNVGMRVAPLYYNSTEAVHTLTEINFRSASQDQAVEAGFTANCSWGGTPPCFFVYHWIDDVPQGYNANFVDYAGSSLNAGDSLSGTTETAGCTSSASARSERFVIRQNDTTGDMMVGVDLCHGDSTGVSWVGHFARSRWASSTEPNWTGGLMQAYTEVATVVDSSLGAQWDGYVCADMGPGGLASTSNGPYPASGQRIADVIFTNVPNSSVNLTTYATSQGGYLDAELPGVFEAHPITGIARYYNVGGPGWATATGNITPGQAGSC